MPIQMEGKKVKKTLPLQRSSKPPTIDLSRDKVLDDPFPLVFEKSVLKSEPPGLTEPRGAPNNDISYMAQDYAKQILEIMNDLRKIKKFCNVVLIVNDAEILAHKSVLAASSTFFRAMFESKQAENQSASVTISGISETIVVQLIEFAYTGNIAVGKENVKDLLSAASSLKFLPVRDACCDFLHRHFSASNTVGIRYFALLEDCSDLVQKSEDFIARNFTDVAKSEEFFMLSYNQVCEIINLQKYPFRNEQVVAIALFCWIHHDLDARKHFFKDLFKLIKLDMLPAPFIMTSLTHNVMVNDCPETKEAVLLTVAKLKLLSEDVSKVTLDSVLGTEPTIIQPVAVLPKRRNCSPPTRKRNNSHISSPRAPPKITLDNGSAFKRKTPSKIPVTVGEVTSAVHTSDSHSSRDHLRTLRDNGGTKRDHLSVRDHVTKRDHLTGDVDQKRQGEFVRGCGNAMFVVGGACNVNMTDAINKVEYYNPTLDKWYEAGPLKKSRSLVGVTVLRGTLYAVGGFDGISPIDTVECYNQSTNTWSSMGRMISARRGAGVTNLNDKIYAVGGYDGTKLLSQCEVYHDNTNSWEPIATLQTCRFALGAASLDKKIYAVGGFDGLSHLSTVEMYDPYSNSWNNVASMSMSRYAVGVTSLNNCIYAVGGLDGTRPLATVERYDPRADKWSAVAEMDTQRAGVDVAVLNEDLYSVGGILGSSPLQTVEKLDIRANKWVYVAEMSIPRVDAGAGSISLL
ncbi:kelch-like protein 20 [Bolinopsis microptera]|uniref:kelch-like protein 20 n=1 Tax=Bolinopsis microptera TaxID=2820187 RepID=UPI003078C466